MKLSRLEFLVSESYLSHHQPSEAFRLVGPMLFQVVFQGLLLLPASSIKPLLDTVD